MIMLANELKTSVLFLPDGRPAPMVLTATEVVKLLRLESKNPLRTLKYYRDEGQLKGIIVGRKVRYRLIDVRRFLADKAGENGD